MVQLLPCAISKLWPSRAKPVTMARNMPFMPRDRFSKPRSSPIRVAKGPAIAVFATIEGIVGLMTMPAPIRAAACPRNVGGKMLMIIRQSRNSSPLLDMAVPISRTASTSQTVVPWKDENAFANVVVLVRSNSASIKRPGAKAGMVFSIQFRIVQTVIPPAMGIIKAQMENVKAVVVPVWNAIKPVIINTMHGIAAVIKAVWPVVASIVKRAIMSIKTAIDGIKSIVSKVTATFNKVKTAITKPIETAKSMIQKAIDKIKSIFNKLKLKLPHFNLPHFSVSGGKAPFGIGGKGSMPKFSVKWYAEGGIFDDPSLIGVGEKGAEAVIPLDPFWKKLDNLERSGGDVTINNTITVDGAEDPENWAMRFAERLRMEVRMA